MAKKKKKQKQKKQYEMPLLEQDENFYFIAGYTFGGAPYGITWEQAYEEGMIEDGEEDGDFPF
ncbi:MAG: hypothetical protein II842_06855 [Butyrivibrio sp.]|nr:hypothetical protein [Butyrivibrio sp.]